MSIAGQGKRGMFGRVERRDIDVDEADSSVLKRCFGRGREVRVARTKSNDPVRVASDAVGGERTGGADRTEVERVVEAEAALAGHCFSDRNPSPLDEVPKSLRCSAVDDTTTGDNKR